MRRSACSIILTTWDVRNWVYSAASLAKFTGKQRGSGIHCQRRQLAVIGFLRGWWNAATVNHRAPFSHAA